MRFADRGSGASRVSLTDLARMTNAFGQGAGALPSDFDEAGVAGDLIECGKSALRLGQKLVVQVGFELQQGVVDAEAVVLHAALEQRY